MAWAAAILDEALRLGNDLAEWRYLDGPAGVAERATLRYRRAIVVGKDPPQCCDANELMRQFLEFDNRRSDLAFQLSKLLPVEGDDGRMRFDDDSRTITLDGKPFREVHPDAFQYFREIWHARPTPMVAADIAGPAFAGLDPSAVSTHVSKAIRKLPPGLKKVHTSTSKGHSIVLPPRPEKGQ